MEIKRLQNATLIFWTGSCKGIMQGIVLPAVQDPENARLMQNSYELAAISKLTAVRVAEEQLKKVAPTHPQTLVR